MKSPSPVYFASPAEFRAWLEKHHATATELWVGFHKRHTGRPSLAWPESVDEALSFGWIDGIRKSVDADRYTIRFTPRKPKSNWSNVNIRRIEELSKLGLVAPAGWKAFEERDTKRDYSYEETRQRSFTAEQEKTFRANRKAWAFFEKQPPGYRKTLIYWVTSAKKEETRTTRLQKLIEASAAGRRIGDSFTVKKRKA
jgi:uncharacterized protein YdeI (YjbR/CyaY-like superfamily)